MMQANCSTLVKLCLLTALAVPMQQAASAVSPRTIEDFNESAETNHDRLIAQRLIAQASGNEFPLPDSLEEADALVIDGSSSMRAMNEALTQRFQERYEQATVDNTISSTDIALERLQNGEIDLAAIGRPLTEAEREAGLIEVNIAREKIAIFVSADNPFNGDLEPDEFSKIFRGEVTDWSEISEDAAGPIRFVDRPDSSDTRQAFQPYPVFQGTPFIAGTTATPVEVDETETVIAALGSDGIGYAIANQVMGHDGVRIVPMHQTLPDDPRYPFSQPRSYVYLGEPSPAIQGFLAIANSPEGQTAVAAVQATEGAAAAEITGPPVTQTSPDGKLTALSNEDNLAVIQDASGEIVAGPLAGAGGAITALAFSEDGQTLATGTHTGRVRYWGIDGQPKGDVFKPNPDGSAITNLRFDGNEKLSVASEGRRGFWGLNGLPYGETAAPSSTAGTGTDTGSPAAVGTEEQTINTPPWWWLIALLAVLGLGAWLLNKKRRQQPQTEAVRQTAPTATVPPPTDNSQGDHEVSNRAQSIITTDRVIDESRDVPSETTPAPPPTPLPVGFPGVDSPPDTSHLPEFESTDLESPNIEDPNLELTTPDTTDAGLGGAAVLGGVTALGAIAATAGFNAETEDTEDDDWDDNLNLTLEDPPPGTSTDNAPPETTSNTDIRPEAPRPDPPKPDTPKPKATPPLTAETSAEMEAFWNTAPDQTKANLSSLNAIDPTPDMIVAETDVIPDIEPTESTIIGDSAVIGTSPATFGEATAEGLTAEVAEPNIAAPNGSDIANSSANAAKATHPDDVAGGNATTNVDTVIATSVAAGLVTGAATAVSRTHQPSPLSVTDLASVDEGLAELPDGYGVSQIVLLPRDPKWAYAYWDISNDHKEALRQQGGQRLMLRLYDVTNIDHADQTPHSMQQHECHEMARSWYLEIPVSDRDYSVEIGYLTPDDHWLMLARSAPIRVPPIYPSDWVKDQYVTISWDESLENRTFGNLGRQPDPAVIADMRTTGLPMDNGLFGLPQHQGLQHMAGSMFGSMHQLTPGALSPSGMVSGLNMSGLNVSGLNVSGLNMSGVGIGKRNFWLVADAELIVYGATEPDAILTVGDRVIPLNADGTFRFHVAFPDGQIDYPIKAVAADGEQSRSINMHFERETPERHTNKKEDAEDEWFF